MKTQHKIVYLILNGRTHEFKSDNITLGKSCSVSSTFEYYSLKQ